MTRDPGQSIEGPLTTAAARRLRIFAIGAAVLILVLVLRLWFLQVVRAQDFEAQATANTVRTQVLPAPRGTIVDRRGRALARNRDGWDLVAVPVDLDNEAGMKMLARLARALGKDPATLQRAVRRRAADPARSGRQFAIESDIDSASPLYLALNERIDDFPGIRLDPSEKRDYPEGEYVSHLVGGVGKIPAERLEALKREGYRNNAFVGVSGLEQFYERYLRGSDGSRRVEVDVTGDPTSRGVLSEVPAKPGYTLQTSIDLDVQYTLARQLREKVLLNGASYSGGGGVVLDIQTGEVVAMASFPFMDPNKISAGRAPNYNRNPRKPAINRALQAFPPASTMKPITALAALDSGNLVPDEVLESPKALVIEGQPFRNFRDQSHGFITLPDALRVSSDTYFYQVAYRMYQSATEEQKDSGDTALWRWAKELGLGQVTDIDLIPGDSAGVVPDRLWKVNNIRKGSEAGWNQWRPGDTVNMAVGQGYLLVSPLQMARAYAALLDPEHRVQTPTIVRRVVDPSSQKTVFEPNRARAAAPTLPPIDESYLEAITDGMLRAVTYGDGTATSVFGRFGGLMAGKTGTAETREDRNDHAWFIGYGPAVGNVQPKYVVAVVVEHAGLGGSVAAPVACHTLAVALEADESLCGRGDGEAD